VKRSGFCNECGFAPTERSICERCARNSLLARLVGSVAPDARGCWIWTKHIQNKGYGVVGVAFPEKRVAYAHRMTCELWHGPIPEGFHVDHLCRNPPCCNPWHLEAVSPAENARRGISRAAVMRKLGVCHRGHPLSGPDADVRTNVRGALVCRPCAAIRRRRVGPTVEGPHACECGRGFATAQGLGIHRGRMHNQEERAA